MSVKPGDTASCRPAGNSIEEETYVNPDYLSHSKDFVFDCRRNPAAASGEERSEGSSPAGDVNDEAPLEY